MATIGETNVKIQMGHRPIPSGNADARYEYKLHNWNIISAFYIYRSVALKWKKTTIAFKT